MNNKMRLSVYFMVMGMAILLVTVAAFSQEGAAVSPGNQEAVGEMHKEPSAPAPTMEATVVTATEPAETTAPSVTMEETKWLWAEIAAVDPATNQITVKYLSYDSDEEKELTLSVDSATKMENFKALSEMTAGDNVSVDYVQDSSGKALAKSISLQKAKPISEITSVSEPLPASVAEVTTAAPETAAPTVTAPAVVTNTETATSAAEQK